VLLVDSREPVDFFNKLSEAGVTCERRVLATFDFLWVGRCTTATATTTTDITSSKDQVDEFVLGHACERKEIRDLAHSLNNNNKTTGLIRSKYQRLKMDNSGVENKLYIVQGAIVDLYKTHMQHDFTMRKRVHEHIKDMERDGYTIYFFPQDAATQIVHFLRDMHRYLESQLANKKPLDSYMTLTAMTERADWVTKLGSAKKLLPRGSFGEKKMRMILNEFPTSFKMIYYRDSAAIVQRLASLNTDKRSGISKSTAQTLCTNLFGVVARTKTTPKAASIPVTPETSQDVADSSAVTAKRRLFSALPRAEETRESSSWVPLPI
jgi:ERCC4-type nuclease